jgi:NDP-sugar pyrophosphorylase family protein
MILAAGYGTRLWPLTVDRAKPAIPFLGRPLVGYVAEYLARHGCREIAVNLHHRPESVRAALGDGTRFGVRLHYVEEPTILGTSGALDNARDFLDGDTFVVVNGKIATDIDLGAAVETHRRTGALATLVVRPNEARESYSTVEIDDHLLRGFGGHPPQASDNAGDASRVSQKSESGGAGGGALGASGRSPGESSVAEAGGGVGGGAVASAARAFITREPRARSGYGRVPLMFTGIHILEPRVFDYVPRGVFSDSVTDVYPRAYERGETLAAHVGRGYWYELSTIRRYLETSVALMQRQGRAVEAGEGSFVGEGADVSDAVLWEDVRVESGARVRGAVLGAGVRARRGEAFEDCAVVRAELIEGEERPAKALRGEVRGDNFVVPLAQ